MGRDFDGTNDNITFGTDASINDFTVLTIGCWVRKDTVNASMYIMGKNLGSNVYGITIANNANGNRFNFRYQWSTTQGIWEGNTAINSNSLFYHLVATYDNTAAANDPTLYLNNIIETFFNDTNPTGTPNLDAARTLRIGEDGGAGADLNGLIAHFFYSNEIFTAADVNRAFWWGRAKGGLGVYHPFITDKLNNEGSATANGTASGTTVASMQCPVVRPGSAMMGMGIGW